MKIYIDDKDIGTTISYQDNYGVRQNLWVHDKEGFIFKSLQDYIKEVEQENEQLKQQLAEKDKEIEELKEKLYWTENGVKLALLMERHKVCEEIREKAEYKNWSIRVPFVYVIKPEILDKIEGERR